MTFTIELGWWIAPALFTIVALIALFVRASRADAWDFGLLFIAPATAFAICFAWMLYFGIGWALS